DVLISIAPFTERNFRRLYPGAKRIVTIPNGIDLAPYQERASRPTGLDPAIREGSYALYLGRLARRKGVDVLLKALTELPAEPGVRLVVAGSGDDEAELRALAASHALGDRVRFVGRVDGADKLYLLQNAIATVMPSRVWEA